MRQLITIAFLSSLTAVFYFSNEEENMQNSSSKDNFHDDFQDNFHDDFETIISENSYDSEYILPFSIQQIQNEGRKILISSKYGYRRDPISGSLSHHDGIDFAIPKGSSVLSVKDGVVEDVGAHKSYGNYVKIRHDENISTFYAHLQEATVKKGNKVKKGDIIGLSGSTGYSTGPHLHLEFRKDADNSMKFATADPQKYIPALKSILKNKTLADKNK